MIWREITPNDVIVVFMCVATVIAAFYRVKYKIELVQRTYVPVEKFTPVEEKAKKLEHIETTVSAIDSKLNRVDKLEAELTLIAKTYLTKDDHTLITKDTEEKISRIDTNVTRIMERLEMNNTH